MKLNEKEGDTMGHVLGSEVKVLAMAETYFLMKRFKGDQRWGCPDVLRLQCARGGRKWVQVPLVTLRWSPSQETEGMWRKTESARHRVPQATQGRSDSAELLLGRQHLRREVWLSHIPTDICILSPIHFSYSYLLPYRKMWTSMLF